MTAPLPGPAATLAVAPFRSLPITGPVLVTDLAQTGLAPTQITSLMQKLDAPTARDAELNSYYAATQPMAFLAPEARAALGTRMGRLASNICRVAVRSLAERLRITGFMVDGTRSSELWDDWIRNDLDQHSRTAHREMLVLGRCYVIVWAGPDGRPQVTVESARQVAVVRDPASDRIVMAVKRWNTATTTEAVVYLGDRVVKLRANQPNATTQGWTPYEVLPNPLGRPPVVELRNTDRLPAEGVSEIADLLPLVDALNKLLADMMVGSEFYARPRRWGTGIELEERPVLDSEGNPVVDEDGEPITEAVNPYPEGHRMMISEDPAAKFGSLPPADLASYEAALRVVSSQIMAVSSLPGHYLGQLASQPPNAEGMRAAEASLVASAEAIQGGGGRDWEDVGRLMVAVRTGRAPETIQVRVRWADAGTRSVAQETDAAVKLYQADQLLPASFVLTRLGYDEDDLRAIKAARQQEAVEKATAEITAKVQVAQSLQAQGMSQVAALAAVGLFAAANETRADATALPSGTSTPPVPPTTPPAAAGV